MTEKRKLNKTSSKKNDTQIIKNLINGKHKADSLISLSKEIDNPLRILERIRKCDNQIRILVYIVFENKYWERSEFKDECEGKKTEFINKVLKKYTSICNAYRQYNMAVLEGVMNSPMGELKERQFRSLASAHKEHDDFKKTKTVLNKIKKFKDKTNKMPGEKTIDKYVFDVFGKSYLNTAKDSSDYDDSTSNSKTDYGSDFESAKDLIIKLTVDEMEKIIALTKRLIAKKGGGNR